MDKNKQSKPLFVIQCYEDRQQTVPLKKAEIETTDYVNNNGVLPKRESTDHPPPPPPMPLANGHQNGFTENNNNHKPLKKEAPKVPIIKNGTLTRTPTPDYNSTSAALKQKSIKDERVELESLESYKLKNPSNVQPKPPTNYFMQAPNGTATMKKNIRPVSVTIGEYGHGGRNRKEPSKLDFLNGDKVDGGPRTADDESISNRLQSELALTLSRSNLRKKTDTLIDAGR